MKSIKEKAEERVPYAKEDSWDRIKAAINAQTSFEAGANYVLDIIEQYCKEHVVCNSNIKHIIEQLKK